MYTSFKFRIYPTSEQEAIMMKTFVCVRYLYNRILADKEAHYALTGNHLTIRPAHYKKECAFLKEADSLALNYAERAIANAYQKFHKSETAFPQKKNVRSHSRLSYTTCDVNGNFLKIKGYIRLPKVGLVKTVFHRDIPDDYLLQSVTVSKTPSGKYFASINFLYETKTLAPELKRSVGLDFSLNGFYVSSDGTRANLVAEIKSMEDKLHKEYVKLKRCRRGSNNHAKQREEISKMHEHITNYRNDVLRKHARRLSLEYDCIYVETLDLQKMKNETVSKTKILRNAYGTFLRYLEQKMNQEGKIFFKVPQYYPSTKTCSHCGNIQDMRLCDRVYNCNGCGMSIDRDINAAHNIKREGERLLMKESHRMLGHS